MVSRPVYVINLLSLKKSGALFLIIHIFPNDCLQSINVAFCVELVLMGQTSSTHAAPVQVKSSTHHVLHKKRIPT